MAQPYEVMLDVALVAVRYAADHEDCPETHRHALHAVAKTLDALYEERSSMSRTDAHREPERPGPD